MTKSKLISSGSYGCVFYPKIPCDKEKHKTKNKSHTKRATKLILIDDSLMKQEEKEITEDLIVAAINDAKQKGEAAAQEEMKKVTGGISLPPGMKLPF